LAFSFTLFLALILLFPGLCGWAALRLSARTNLLTPRPDKPNSTATLFIIVLGTIGGHLLGAWILALQAILCKITGQCLAVDFDPNVYRVLMTAIRSHERVSDLAIATWFLELALMGVVTGTLIERASRASWVQERWDALDYGWLGPAVQAVKVRDTFVVAYVVTRTEHEGASIAYEGIVRQLAKDDDQTITMLVLINVDRFLVKITDAGVERLGRAQNPIAQMQFHLAEIANIALEVIERPAPA
jgi:hypothetical protein